MTDDDTDGGELHVDIRAMTIATTLDATITLLTEVCEGLMLTIGVMATQAKELSDRGVIDEPDLAPVEAQLAAILEALGALRVQRRRMVHRAPKAVK